MRQGVLAPWRRRPTSGEGTPREESLRPAVPDRIFLCYRRDDTEHAAGRLGDRLRSLFGESTVFIDVESISAGVDFVEAIQRALRRTRVLLAVIGPRWSTLVNESGVRRLDDPGDFVVLELREAFARGVHVVPVLLDGAPMPRADELPEAIRPLVRRHAVRVDGESFRSDVDALLEHLEELVPAWRGVRERASGRRHNGLFGVPVTRRVVLRAAGSVAALAVTGVGVREGHRLVTGPPPPLWTFDTGDKVFSSPNVSTGVVYVGSNDSHLYAVDLSSGERLWRYPTGGAVTSSPAVADGVVYVGSNDQALHAVHADTGAPLWTFPTGAAIHSSPTVSGDTVYVGSRDNGLYAVHRETGEQRWRFSGGEHEDLVQGFNSSPTVADGLVVIGCRDHNVYGVDADQGFQRWRRTTNSTVDSSAAIAGGSVFIGSDDHRLWALRTSDGTPIWHFLAEGGIVSTPVFHEGVVFVGSDDGNLYAVDATTGRLFWSFPTDGGIRSSPAVDGGLVYVGSRDFRLYAVDRIDGRQRWEYRTGGPIDDSSPAVSGDVVVVGSLDGTVYAVDARRGARSELVNGASR